MGEGHHERAIQNPFTPRFGGTPESFFGREEVIRPFLEALDQLGSSYRALFITGVRGLGKTSLVEKLSQLARDAGWDVYDLPPYDTVETLIGKMLSYDEITKINEPEVSAKIGPVGFSQGGVGEATTWHVGKADLSDVFLHVSSMTKRGVLVTVDEVQKVPVEDVARICSAFQMASRKGHSVALVVAGLPYAYSDISEHEGCSYMRRARHVELQLLGRDEVRHAFEATLATLDPTLVKVREDALGRLVDVSKGQPFFMQLVGYELVSQAIVSWRERGSLDVQPYIITKDRVDLAFGVAMESYEEQQLDPIIIEAGPVGKLYLQAMARVMRNDRLVAASSEVAEELGRTTGSLASVHRRLLRLGIIASPRHNALRFNVPYLREYLKTKRFSVAEERRLDEWRV